MRHSLMLRALVAILLMVAFFALAIGAAGGLLWGAYAVGELALGYTRGRSMGILMLLSGGMGFAGFVVAWSILPRIDRFEPPGPELTAELQPALFREIHRTAAMTGQAPPAHVYLVAGVNAFVTQRGGWMGLGSRRVMGIGYGMMNLLTVGELRAVLAHEFGHFHGGDTRLGPWIHKTRAAIARTVSNLYDAGDLGLVSQVPFIRWIPGAVGKPFHWFGLGYLRITLAISRAQELAADRMAVTTQGTKPMVDSLRKVNRGGMAFNAFIREELMPALGRQLQPPVGEGFRRFLSSRHIARQLDDAEREELEAGAQDPHDSHPPLRERIRHAEALNSRPLKDDPRLAVELLVDVPELESIFCSGWAQGRPLERVRWEQLSAQTAG